MLLTIPEITKYFFDNYQGIKPKNSWGETSFFYNPGNTSPHGAYFLTIKEKDGENDKASNLDRQGIYRLNFGISETTFETLFGSKPKRPAKGGVITGNYDFTALNVLTPHPVYGWMQWVSILNPEAQKFNQIKPLIEESYSLAVHRFKKQ